jgi:SAM-dependent methyltransferase
MPEDRSRSLRARVSRRLLPMWRKACRFSFSRGRISRDSLDAMCAELASREYTLVVHCNDIDHKLYFPNSFVVAHRERPQVDLPTDRRYTDLALLSSESFDLIVCTALLEHHPDPPSLVGEFHRILRPGGRLIVSGSSVFPSHGNPYNYFHFTPNGFRHLFRDWAGFERLEGSSRPFKTIAILLQRIHMQCDIFPLVRPLIELSYHLVPALDVFILREYDVNSGKDERGPVDSMMPARLHAVVIR